MYGWPLEMKDSSYIHYSVFINYVKRLDRTFQGELNWFDMKFYTMKLGSVEKAFERLFYLRHHDRENMPRYIYNYHGKPKTQHGEEYSSLPKATGGPRPNDEGNPFPSDEN